jgi:flavin-dependent dehydrogenase
MTDQAYDVVIVGTGTAGCAAALALPAGARALLVDRSTGAIQRCCGGLLTSDSLRNLAGLGLALPDHVRVGPEPRYVRVHDLDSGREQSYRRDYVNLNRGRFDEWLLGLAAARATVERQARFAGVTADGGVVLRSGSKERVVRTVLLIGADGANSTVRRRCFPDHPGPKTMLAVQAYLAFSRAPEFHDVLFDSRLSTYYAWAIPKPDHVIVGCAFEDRASAGQAFEEVLAWYKEALDLGEEIAPRSARYLSRPRQRHELYPGTGRVLLVGEAAGLVSPSSGEGISFALSSGAAAGRAVAAEDPIQAYRREFARLARRIIAKKLKAGVIFSPRLRSWALRLPWYP